MSSAVVLVHANADWRAAAREALEAAGYGVRETPEFPAAWSLIETGRCDVILLPWTTARGTREALGTLREHTLARLSRLIVWAAHQDIPQAVDALEHGADDCLGVPFERAELIARVNACLRRPPAEHRPDRLVAGALILDKAVHRLTVANHPVELAPAEFRLLAFFLENPGRVFSRDELLRRAWPRHVSAGHRTVDVHVRRLRQMLEPFDCDGWIQTVRGFGYRFAQPAQERRIGFERTAVRAVERP